MTDSNEKASTDTQQNTEQDKLNVTLKIVEGVQSIIADGSVKDIIMAIKSNPDSIVKFELAAKMVNKFYNKLFLFAALIFIIGGILIFLGHKAIGGQMIFSTLGFLGGYGFGVGVGVRNNE